MYEKVEFINMSRHAEKPYNELPLLPPAAQGIETNKILKACIGAVQHLLSSNKPLSCFQTRAC